MGPLKPLFWTSGDVSSGFQSQSGFCLLVMSQGFKARMGSALFELSGGIHIMYFSSFFFKKNYFGGHESFLWGH